jgi:hypothetical protein
MLGNVKAQVPAVEVVHHQVEVLPVLKGHHHVHHETAKEKKEKTNTKTLVEKPKSQIKGISISFTRDEVGPIAVFRSKRN